MPPLSAIRASMAGPPNSEQASGACLVARDGALCAPHAESLAKRGPGGMHRPPITAIAAATLMLAAPLQLSAATPPLESESFQIGTEGALCEAQGLMLGQARVTLFDRKWALICADVDRPI